MKKLFVLIVLMAGIVSLQAQDIRKGLHLGAHFTPGYGTILTEAYENLAYDFGMTAGLDVNYYFTDLLGIHTGVIYLNQPWKYDLDMAGGGARDISATVNAIGIPAEFLLTTGKGMVGFYLEVGVAVYFPISYTSDPDRGILKTSTAMFGSEAAVGINLRVTEKINLSASLYSNTTLPVFSNLDQSYGMLSGVKLGFMYNLSK